jgi:uncharacterized Zn finger protein (UPF0148 family)
MPLRIVCSCGAKLNAKEELIGKSVKCPKCGNPIKVTAEAAEEAPTAKPKAEAAAKAKATKQPAAEPAGHAAMHDLFDEIGLAPVQPKADIQCPKCGAAMTEGAVICISCGFNTKTGKQLSSSSDGDAEANREKMYAQQAAKAAAKTAKDPNPYAAPGFVPDKAKAKNPADEFQTLDWIVCFLCPGIGIICGLIYAVTGKPKGLKMLGISVAVAVVLNVIFFVAGAMLGTVASK